MFIISSEITTNGQGTFRTLLSDFMAMLLSLLPFYRRCRTKSQLRGTKRVTVSHNQHILWVCHWGSSFIEFLLLNAFWLKTNKKRLAVFTSTNVINLNFFWIFLLLLFNSLLFIRYYRQWVMVPCPYSFVSGRTRFSSNSNILFPLKSKSGQCVLDNVCLYTCIL